MPVQVENVRTKGIHVKLDRQTHANFKACLVHHGLSMQEVFEEFARLVGSGNLSANRMIDGLIRRQLKKELAEAGIEPLKRDRRNRMRELDPESLYALIDVKNDDVSE